MSRFLPNPNFEREAELDPRLLAQRAKLAREVADLVAANSANIMPRKGHKVAEVVQEGGTVYVVTLPTAPTLTSSGRATTRRAPPFAALPTRSAWRCGSPLGLKPHGCAAARPLSQSTPNRAARP